MVMHFSTQQERLAYLRGEFEEITPVEVKAEEPKNDSLNAEIAEKPQKKGIKTQKIDIESERGREK